MNAAAQLGFFHGRVGALLKAFCRVVTVHFALKSTKVLLRNGVVVC